MTKNPPPHPPRRSPTAIGRSQSSFSAKSRMPPKKVSAEKAPAKFKFGETQKGTPTRQPYLPCLFTKGKNNPPPTQAYITSSPALLNPLLFCCKSTMSRTGTMQRLTWYHLKHPYLSPSCPCPSCPSRSCLLIKEFIDEAMTQQGGHVQRLEASRVAQLEGEQLRNERAQHLEARVAQLEGQLREPHALKHLRNHNEEPSQSSSGKRAKRAR
jgi:hypothetical protein